MNEGAENILIRDFRKSDLDNLLDIASESFTEEIEISGFDPDHIKKMVDKMFGVLGKVFLGFLKLMRKEPFKFFVAEVDGRVVGTTMVNNRGMIGYISTVMVHPNYRRKGIATKLMKRALDHIQKKKTSKAVLHVVSTNTPAKNLYTKLGFTKFENVVYMIGNIDSLLKSEKVEVQVRDLKKNDIDAVYDLIRRSENPEHLKVFGFKKKDLKTPLINRIFHFSTDKKIVATKNKKIVGYIQSMYTTKKEAGRIRHIHVLPEMISMGIEETLISAGADHIQKAGTNKVLATVSSTKQKLVEKMKHFGFKKRLEMEAMVLKL